MIDLEDLSILIYQYRLNDNTTFRLTYDPNPDAWIPEVIIDINTDISTEIIDALKQYMADNYYELKDTVRNGDSVSLRFRKLPPY